ncbi:MAG: ATP-NAD kinase family protein [Pseudomonadota bacterium]
MHRLRIGVLVNPYAGIGGALALKGSDGAEIREKALSAGAAKNALPRMSVALSKAVDHADSFEIFTASGEMGEAVCQQLGLPYKVVYTPQVSQTEADDTISAAHALLSHNIELFIFAGGDGTARNIVEADPQQVPVIGVPAGCKIHSGVYAITPQGAGEILVKILNHELVSLMPAEVRDIDENKFREGIVTAKYYGELMVPADLAYIQAVKSGGKEQDELVLIDIADDIKEQMDEEQECCFVMGSGSTVDAIMRELGLENTLLGVDIVLNGKVIAKDVTSQQLMAITQDMPCKLVITAIGGQGHIFGRGNQQLSVDFIKRIQRKDLLIVATKSKLKGLGDGGFIADTGDPALDKDLAGPIGVVTGYRDKVLYFVRG